MKIEEIAAKVFELNIEEINDELSPLTCGNWTSLKHLTLIGAIEKEYNVKFSFKDMKKIHNIGSLKQALKERGVDNV